MNNYKLTQTGPEVQEILDRVPMIDNHVTLLQEESRDADENLQQQIDELVAEGTAISLKASPTVGFAGKSVSVSLVATSSKEAGITIKDGDNVISSGTGTTISGNVTIQGASSVVGDKIFTALFAIGQVTRQTTAKVSLVYPIYYGAGASYGAAMNNFASARTSPAGTYNVSVEEAGSYIFFLVPATMTIKKATLNGFDFPLENPTAIEISNVAYKCYRSSNTYDAGTLPIVLS